MKILLCWEIEKEEEAYLRENLRNYDLNILLTKDPKKVLSEAELSSIEIIIAGIANKKIIENSPNLKLIQSMISGVSHIDLEAAEKKGVIVSSIKGASSSDVAEHTMMLILNLVKNTPKYFSDIIYRKWDKIYSDTLEGKTLGVIGLGNIGTNVSKLASAFGMNIVANRYHPKLGNNGINLNYLGGKQDLDEILKRSDIVILSVPKTKETISMINEETVQNIKDGSYLINISRGPIVEENAVYNALKIGKLSGFGTDVFPTEPNNFSFPLYHNEKVICTPHIAAYTIKSKLRCLNRVVENINLFSSGKNISNVVDFQLGY